MGSSLFAIGVGIRAAIIGAVAFVAIWLLSLGHYYATALVLIGIVTLLIFDISRRAAKADRMFEGFVDSLSSGEFEKPVFGSGRYASFRRSMSAMERHGANAKINLTKQQQQSDYLQTLTDNVTVVLLAVGPDGSVILLNRAATQFAGYAVASLNEIDLIGELGAEALLSLPAGQRTVLRLTNGQRVLVSAARFSAGGSDRRLISLQNIETELDEVELKAWQDLVRILSHEIMNSLTPISSLADSILPLVRDIGASDLNATARKTDDITVAIEAISRRSSSLISFVERYRKIAALPRPMLQTVHLGKLVSRIENLIGSVLASKSIKFESRIEPEDLCAQADPDLLEQALINLLNNAIEAVADTSNPHIEILCTHRQQHEVTIAIADNGGGLDPASYDRIFLPFFTTKPGGSGIGLSLTRQIALAHKGQIEVSPNHVQGTIFTLVLPARPPDFCEDQR